MIVWLCVLAALYLLFFVSIIKTDNMKSAVIFKFIPLLIVVLLIVIAARDAGWVVHV